MASGIHSYSYPYPATLALEKICLDIHLGVTEEERTLPQKVYISIKLYFPEPPTACKNDSLDDTICYDQLCKAIQSYCLHKSFKLIEYLGYQLYKLAREMIASDIKIHITVEKCNPPIEYLHGSALFSYSDVGMHA